METASLKSFATWARTALIREVTARIAVVLAPASPERVEQPKNVAALEKAVSDAGSGDRGRSAVADRVAYTWFNRIVALRFMDANGYTGIGVVSPQAGVDVGQPEILAESKRANIDSDVVSQAVRETVTGLLNGTRGSDDPQGEAYALLLAEYCRYWNRAMPFMFERQGDFTELLLPASLLADDSVLNRAVAVLTPDVCRDVEVIGWLYQFYISELKEQINDSNVPIGAENLAPVTQLFTPHWIVRYLVENSLGRLWMRSRPSSQLRERMNYYVDPVEGQTDRGIVVSSPEQIRVVDPCSGSGHMLTYAFDLLCAIYEEEGFPPSEIPELILTHNLRGLDIDGRAAQLASFALAMKARARDRRFLQRRVQPDVIWVRPLTFGKETVQRVLDTVAASSTAGGPQANADAVSQLMHAFRDADTYGSLIRVEKGAVLALDGSIDQIEANAADLYASHDLPQLRYLVRQATALSDNGYHVVVTNPPYLGSGNMGTQLNTFAKEQFPTTKGNLFSMFIDRSAELACPAGSVAMVTMHSWMFLTSYKGFRTGMPGWGHLSSMMHLGARAFDSIGGEIVQAVAFVIDTEVRPDQRGIFFRLLDGRNESDKELAYRLALEVRDDPNRFIATMNDFLMVPESPIVYWLSDAMKAAFSAGSRLKDVAVLAVGLQTGENDRFLRQWYEVSSGKTGLGIKSHEEAKCSAKKWFPHNKGGGFRKWWGNQDYVINWEGDGRDLWEFRPRSVIRNPDYYFKSAVAWSEISSDSCFRFFPEGFIPSNKSPFVASAEADQLLAYLNSAVVTHLARAISPGTGVELGQIATLPFVQSDAVVIQPVVDELVSIFRRDWNDFESSWDFVVNPVVALGPGLLESLAESRWDAAVAATRRAQELEEENNQYFARLYGLEGEVECAVPLARVSLTQNPYFQWAPSKGATRSEDDYRAALLRDVSIELVSYAVGCIFGRYSLNEPGLVLADQGATLQDYLARVPTPTFMPDADNVIPIVDGDWFEDDIVARFRQFLRVAFGELHFEENLGFVAESLGVKDLRDYFVKSFYKDHVQRYKKRPIYWLFSSPKGSFNALVYMHRYTPSTVSTVLNEYLREYKAKLGASLQHHERLAAGGGTPREQAAAQKEADRLRKVLLELDEYEHDVLYPLASRQIEIDLDDGVKVNYAKFGAALKKIPGLEVAE